MGTIEKSKKAISVILPVYNGGKMLFESVESVLSQDFQDFELLICEDCSTDESLAYLKMLKDTRIRLFTNDINRGLFYNLNFLIKNSESDIIKLWSQDDIMYSNCLVDTVSFHEKHPEISFSYSDRDIIDEHGNMIFQYNGWDTTPEIISPWIHNKIALYTGSIAGNIANVAINKKNLDLVGGFREDMKYSADLDMWERLTINYPIGRICKTLIKLRNHTGQLSRKKGFAIHQLKEDREIFERLIKRTPNDLQPYAHLTQKWKRNVYYFSVLFNYLRYREWHFAKAYYNELKGMDNIFILSIRWLVVKTCAKFGFKIVELTLEGRNIA